MKVVETDDFRKDRLRLPRAARRILDIQINRFCEDSRDPRLHTKRLMDADGTYSFRVTSSYRALFYFQNADTAILFAIGHRKEVYRALR